MTRATNFESELSVARLNKLREACATGKTRYDLAEAISASLAVLSHFLGHLLARQEIHISFYERPSNQSAGYRAVYLSGPAPIDSLPEKRLGVLTDAEVEARKAVQAEEAREALEARRNATRTFVPRRDAFTELLYAKPVTSDEPLNWKSLEKVEAVQSPWVGKGIL